MSSDDNKVCSSIVVSVLLSLNIVQACLYSTTEAIGIKALKALSKEEEKSFELYKEKVLLRRKLQDHVLKCVNEHY